MMMVRIAREKALPFEPLVPNAETIEAMKEARKGRLPRFKTVEALFKDLDAGAMPTVKVVPDKGGVGYIGTLTAEAGEFSNGHLSVHWQFDTDGAAVAETVTQSYDVTLSTVAKSETRAISVTIGGPGSDTFVFAPGLGTDVIANATTSDKFELDGFASITSVHELHDLLSEARAGQSDSLFHAAQGGDDTVIHLGHHDDIILANLHLANLHASNFIIR